MRGPAASPCARWEGGRRQAGPGLRGGVGRLGLLFFLLLLPWRVLPAQTLMVYETDPRPADLHPFQLGGSPAGLRLSAFILERLAHVKEQRNTLDLPLFEPATPGTSRQHLLRLKAGVTFSDGSPVAARDIASSLQRIRAAAARTDASPAVRALARCFFLVDAVTARDARTLLLTFTRPVQSEELAPMLASLPVVRTETSDAALRDGSAPTLAPYRLEAAQPGMLRLAANPRYFLGAPGIPVVEMHYVDADTLTARLQDGLPGQVFVLPPQLVPAALTRSDLEVRVANSRRVLLLGFHQRRGSKLTVPLIRRSIAQLIDVPALLEAIPMPDALRTPLIGPYAPDKRFADLQKDLPQLRYDPDQALATLATLGYSQVGDTLRDGKGQSLSLRLWVDPRVPAGARLATFVREQLTREGLEVTLDPTSAGEPGSRADVPPDADLVIREWLLDEDEGYFEILHSRGMFNHLGLSDTTLDQLLGLERSAMLLASRERYRREIQTRLVEIAAMRFFWQRRDAAAFRVGIRGGAALDPYYLFRSVHTWTIGQSPQEGPAR